MLIIFSLLVLTFGCCQLLAHPVSESPKWLIYLGGEGPGKGTHVVLITADQEYRSEQSLPMLAKVLSKHHGFDCTVLFGVNEKGEVDPTMPVHPKKGEEAQFKEHNIQGLEHLASADLVIFVTRLLTLPDDQLKKIVSYLDSGNPIIALRTANHGFRSQLPYKRDGKNVHFGKDILGGTFREHHGGWHREATRGTVVEELKEHPIVTGVSDIWGPSDVYRTYQEGAGLPEGCTALVWGQPLIGRNYDDLPNTKKEPLPVAWFKNWETSKGQIARVFHSTMGSAKDLESEGLRRMVVNAVYWGMKMESDITAKSNVDYIDAYKPLASGFNYEKLGVIPKPPSAYK
ncbi:ThuA domain-containing protein [Akkermansiaceae bacterium]|nr:ThuA domain-containing protein [Akkermansiaceae bacterium]MDB4274194.1 ThuA domain-containing protein [Akkermansiaceae bacterium]